MFFGVVVQVLSVLRVISIYDGRGADDGGGGVGGYLYL